MTQLLCSECQKPIDQQRIDYCKKRGWNNLKRCESCSFAGRERPYKKPEAA